MAADPAGSALFESVTEPDTVVNAGSSVASVMLASPKSTPQTCSCATSAIVTSDSANLKRKAGGEKKGLRI